jgi:hypothetical protein
MKQLKNEQCFYLIYGDYKMFVSEPPVACYALIEYKIDISYVLIISGWPHIQLLCRWSAAL